MEEGESMSMIRHPMFLRRVLLADAVASGATGALTLLAAAPLSGLLGLPAGLLRAAGLALLPYAAAVAWLALRRAEPARAVVWAVVAINAVWAVDSVLLLLVPGWVAPTALGVAFVLAQAAVVAGFAALQGLGLRTAPPALRAAAA
jgi:hypothetical protein